MTTVDQIKSADISPDAVGGSIELHSPSTSPRTLTSGLLLVALEKVNHTFYLDQCSLPGSAGEKVKGLKAWHTANQSNWQGFAAYVLCKKQYIAVGTLGVGTTLRRKTCD